jgi:hypothetical protein
VIFTKNKKIIYKHYGGKTHECGRAFFDDDNCIIVFDAEKYKKTSNVFFLNTETIIKEIGIEYYNKFKYIIPISDIYHELIHHFQYEIWEKYVEMKYTDIIEASDEIYTYFLTGQSIDYEKESIALWYLSKYILKLKGMNFYMFIRDCIVDSSWESKYLFSNRDMIKLLGESYNGKIDNFVANFKSDFYYKEYHEEFYRDLTQIHNLIFYKW